MIITFHIPGPLRSFTHGESRIAVELKGDASERNLAEALRILWQLHPGVRHRVLTEQGAVREHINIFIGDESIRYTGGLETPLKGDCKISIIPAVSGGSR